MNASPSLAKLLYTTAFEQKNDSQAPSKYSFGQGTKSQQSLVDCQDFATQPKVVFSGDGVSFFCENAVIPDKMVSKVVSFSSSYKETAAGNPWWIAKGFDAVDKRKGCHLGDHFYLELVSAPFVAVAQAKHCP